MDRNPRNTGRRQLRRVRGLLRRGRQSSAQRALQRMLVRVPGHAGACFELGLLSEARPETALSWYKRCVYFNPRQADAWYRMGLLYEKLALFLSAVVAFGSYLRLRPESASPGLYLRLAQSLNQLRYEGTALQFYLKALESDQNNPMIFFSLAQTLIKLGDLDLALESLMTLGRLYPAKLDLISLMMGHLLERQGEAEAARQCYDEALRRQPRQLFWQLKRDLVYPLVPEDQQSIDHITEKITAALSSTLARLSQQPIQLPQEHFFYLAMMHGNIAYTAYHHTPPLEQRQLLAALIARVIRRPAPWQPHVRRGRLHLGIMVAPKSVALGFIYAGAMADRLDPERFQVTVFCQSPEVTQIFTASNRLHFSGRHVGWKLVSDDVYEALRQVRASQLDAMFFTEPGWDFHQYALTMFRVAAVQCTSWMNPGTSGLENMDYFLSSQWMELPEAKADYAESLERWPTFPSWVPGFSFPDPGTRADFGLEDDWHLYACLQNLLKFHPDLDLLVAEILRRDPLGRMIMVTPKERGHLASLLMKRFERRIPDVMERIWVFPELENAQFLQLLQHCDVMLDPLHYGGGTTAYQAVAAGLPIVTLPGDRMIGRITAALCKRVGVEDGIVASGEEYIERAV
ncbi:MAG: tetratricopeptide repeat protein, partial [Candidatus Sericytochromatia bacterium]